VAGVRFRPLQPSDAESLVDLLVAARDVDGAVQSLTRDDLRHLWLDQPGLDLAADTLVAEAPDVGLVGAIAVASREGPVSVARAFLLGTVYPAYRRRGIGTMLLRFGEARGREILAAVDPAIPRQVDVDTASTSADRIALFRRHGFREVRSFVVMLRDLGPGSDPVPDIALPHSVVACHWSPTLDEATRLAHNDAFRDHWGSDPQPKDRWRYFIADAPGFRADCSWLAVAGSSEAAAQESGAAEVAGYVLANVNQAADGSRIGWLGTIGTRRAWRHRGIASALIARALTSFVAVGATTAGLDVDAENPSGAMRVYEALGFRVAETSIIFSKPIEVAS
jgi:mycothiol synthase